MLSPTEALERILGALDDVTPLPPERVPLSDALGRSLAEDVRAGMPLPPFDNSQMDGYSLRAVDAPLAGARLRVAFEVFAGDDRGRALPPGSCARIFTGAPLPPGADCVEMQEEVTRKGGVAPSVSVRECPCPLVPLVPLCGCLLLSALPAPLCGYPPLLLSVFIGGSILFPLPYLLADASVGTARAASSRARRVETSG